MELRKLLSLVLAAVMLIGCTIVTAFAGGGGGPAILGETYTATIHRTLSEVEQSGNAKDIVSTNPDCLKIISITAGKDVEENDIVTVVYKAIKLTDDPVSINYKSWTGGVYGWETFSSDTYDGVIAPSDYLNLESTATYEDKKDIDQNYTFTQTSEEYTDVTKVKLEWTVTDIAATYARNKTWDPDTLTWKETKTVADIANKTAEFTLTNYSSKKVVGTVEFKVADALTDTLTSATFDDNNGKTIDTVVNSDHTIDETKKTNVPSNKITATLTFNKDKFADLTATTSATKYGIYTVTISAAPTVKLTSLTESIGGSTVYYYPVLGGTNPQPDKFYYSTDGVTFTEIPKSRDAYTMSDLAVYAIEGQLFYSGGSLNMVRTVPNISWNDVFKDNSGGLYPYYTSTVYDDLQDVIKTKIASDGTEIVEKVIAFNENDYSYEVLTINGVELIDIYDAYYTTVLSDNTFYGNCCGMLSHIAVASDGESLEMRILVIITPDELEPGDPKYRTENAIDIYGFCALISRIFNLTKVIHATPLLFRQGSFFILSSYSYKFLRD